MISCDYLRTSDSEPNRPTAVQFGLPSSSLPSLLPRFSQMSERTTGDARERLRRSEEETAKARAELARRQDSHERAAREAEQKFRRVEMEREEYKRKFSDLGK